MRYRTIYGFHHELQSPKFNTCDRSRLFRKTLARTLRDKECKEFVSSIEQTSPACTGSCATLVPNAKVVPPSESKPKMNTTKITIRSIQRLIASGAIAPAKKTVKDSRTKPVLADYGQTRKKASAFRKKGRVFRRFPTTRKVLPKKRTVVTAHPRSYLDSETYGIAVTRTVIVDGVEHTIITKEPFFTEGASGFYGGGQWYETEKEAQLATERQNEAFASLCRVNTGAQPIWTETRPGNWTKSKTAIASEELEKLATKTEKFQKEQMDNIAHQKEHYCSGLKIGHNPNMFSRDIIEDRYKSLLTIDPEFHSSDLIEENLEDFSEGYLPIDHIEMDEHFEYLLNLVPHHKRPVDSTALLFDDDASGSNIDPDLKNDETFRSEGKDDDLKELFNFQPGCNKLPNKTCAVWSDKERTAARDSMKKRAAIADIVSGKVKVKSKLRQAVRDEKAFAHMFRSEGLLDVGLDEDSKSFLENLLSKLVSTMEAGININILGGLTGSWDWLMNQINSVGEFGRAIFCWLIGAMKHYLGEVVPAITSLYNWWFSSWETEGLKEDFMTKLFGETLAPWVAFNDFKKLVMGLELAQRTVDKGTFEWAYRQIETLVNFILGYFGLAVPKLFSCDDPQVDFLYKEFSELRGLTREKGAKTYEVARRVFHLQDTCEKLRFSKTPPTARDKSRLDFMLKQMEAVNTYFRSIFGSKDSIRPEPFMVAIGGPTNVGKTSASNGIAVHGCALTMPADMLEGFKANHSRYMYTRFPGNDYWEGYTSDKYFCLWDDGGQQVDSSSNPNPCYFEWIAAINCAAYHVNKAFDKDDSNSYFHSQFCMTTTNVLKFRIQSLVSPAAVARRLHLSVIQCPIVEYCVDPNKPFWERQFNFDKLLADFPQRDPENYFVAKVVEFHEWDFILGKPKLNGRTFTYSELQDVIVAGIKKKQERGKAMMDHHAVVKQRALGDRAILDKIAQVRGPKSEELFQDCVDMVMKTEITDSEEFAISTYQVDLDGQYLDGTEYTTRIPIDFDDPETVSAYRTYTSSLRKWVGFLIKQGYCITSKDNFLSWSADEDWTDLGFIFTTFGGAEDFYEFCDETFDKPSPQSLMSKYAQHFGYVESYFVGFTAAAAIILSANAVSPYGVARADSNIMKGCKIMVAVGSAAAAVKAAHSFIMYLFPKAVVESNPNNAKAPVKKHSARANMKMMAKNTSKKSLTVTEGGATQTLDGLKSLLQRNVYGIRVQGKHQGFVTFLSGHTFVMPLHFAHKFNGMKEDTRGNEVIVDVELYFPLDPEQLTRIAFSWPEDVADTWFNGQVDQIACKLIPTVSRVHRDITKLFPPMSFFEDKNSIYECQMAVLRDKSLLFLTPSVTAVGLFKTVGTLKDENDEYIVYDCLSLQYCVPSTGGDCGAPIFCTDPKVDRHYILGYHIGGINNKITAKSCCAMQMSSECVQSMLADLGEKSFKEEIVMITEGVCDAPPGVVFAPWFEDQPDEFSGFQCLGKIKPHRVPRDSKIVPSALHGRITDVVDGPATLRPIMVNGERVCPIQKSRLKYKHAEKSVPTELLRAVMPHVRKLLLTRHKTPPFPPRLLTFEEAVEGVKGVDSIGRLNMKGSPGYAKSFSAGGSGKSKWIPLDAQGNVLFDSPELLALKAEVTVAIEKMENGIRPLFISSDFIKDERRPLEKVANASTRMFSSTELVLFLINKMYFGDFLRHVIDNKVLNGCAIGINPYDDWDMLGRFLQRDGFYRFTPGDFSGFDAGLLVQVELWALQIMKEFYTSATKKEHMVRDILFQEIINCMHTMFGVLYEMVGSNPSGNFLTTLLNCICNIIMLSAAVVSTGDWQDPEWVAAVFTVVIFVVFGDDNIVGYPPYMHQHCNQDVLTAQLLKLFNMKYTREDKTEGGPDSRELKDISFLKRGFNKIDGRWYACLSKSVVLETLNWEKTNSTREQMILRIEGFCKEASLHGKEFFYEWVPKIQALALRHYNYIVLNVRWEDAFTSDYGMDFNF